MHYLNWSDIYSKYPIAMKAIEKSFDVVSFNNVFNSFIFQHTIEENEKYGEDIDIDEFREFLESHKLIVTPSIGYLDRNENIKYRFEVIDCTHSHMGFGDDYGNRYDCQKDAITMAIRMYEENICNGFIKI